MQHPSLFHLFMLIAPLAAAANLSSSPNAQLTTTQLGVPTGADIATAPQPGQAGHAGRALPSKSIIVLFHLMQFEIYGGTLPRGGDAVVPRQDWEHVLNNVNVQMRPFGEENPTWGEVLLGLQGILLQMIDSEFPYAFHERTWVIGRNMESARTLTIAVVAIRRNDQGSPLGTSNSTTTSASNSSNDTLLIPGPLTAPFHVPLTDMTLLVGSRGPDISQEYAIPGLDRLIEGLWCNAAINGRASPVTSFSIVVPRSGGTTTIAGGSSGRTEQSGLFTEKEVVEMIVGAVYYMLRETAFYATTVTGVKPGRGGRRTPVGELVFHPTIPTVGLTHSGNASGIEMLGGNASVIQTS